MYCPNCGNKIDDDSTFCENCGTKLEVKSEIKNETVKENKSQIESPKEKTNRSTASIMKTAGKRLIAAVLSGVVLCGSMVGTIVNAKPASINISGSATGEAALSKAYSAYENIIVQEKEYIDAYTWQKGHYGNGSYTYDDEPKPIAFADIYGDKTPELIYVKSPDKKSTSTIEIYTFNNGELKEVYKENDWDPMVAGGFYYTLFQVKGDNSLFAYQTGGDESWTTSYFKFEKDDDNNLIKNQICQLITKPDYDNNTSIKEYLFEENKSDEEQYNKTVKSLTDNISSVIMTSTNTDEVFDKFADKNGCAAIASNDVFVYLKSKIGTPYDVEPANVSKSMTQFLLQFRFGYGDHSFDSQNPYTDDERDNIIYRIMTNATCCNSFIYPGENPVLHWGDDGSVDPKKKYLDGNYCSFLEYHIDKAKWIAKNIFNISDENIEKLIQNGESDDLFYIENGIAYMQLGGVGGPSMDIKYDSVKFDGKRYRVVGSHFVEGDYDDSATRFSAELDYKNIDGIYYWTLYKQDEVNVQDENTEVKKVNEKNLFNYLNKVCFTFSSGVGGWSTGIKFYGDGRFDGSFSDANLGEIGDGYPNGTMLSCSFKGKMKNPKKIDDYSYSLELDYLNVDSENERITDGIRIIPSDPYGMEKGKKYILYLPGANIKTMPGEFVEWISMPMSWNDYNTPDTLPFFGLYNVDEKYGFFSGDDKIVYTVDVLNKPTNLSIDFNNNKKIDLKWGWDLFNKDASEYDHNIAMAGLILSQAAELGESEIEQRYKSLGFENIRPVFYNTKSDYMDEPAVCYATSKVDFNNKNKYIVSITVRGTDTNDIGDILTDLGSVITGFNTAANNIRNNFKSYYEQLQYYYDEKLTADNTILFITGHSLGGAVAGQLGQMLEGTYSHRNSIFDYTFASPNYQTFEYDKESFTNIHNIVNKQDLVPTVPWGYGKYGHCWYYDSCEGGMSKYLKEVYTAEEWEDIQKSLNDNTLIFIGALNRGITGIVSNHICQTYLACMLKDTPQNVGKGAKSEYSLSSIHCPVDIKVLDKDGNIAAWTKGDQVFYTEGADLVLVIDNDEKYVYVPNGIDYNIVFTGTGDGTMTYKQQTISGDKIVSEKIFESVEIKPDKMFYANVNSGRSSSQNLQVISSDGIIEKNVSETGKESKPLFNFPWFEWLFIALDVASLTFLIINLVAIVKKKNTLN